MLKQIFLSLSLMVVSQLTYTMENQQKPSLSTLFIRAIRKKNDTHREQWIQGYISHTQQKEQQSSTKEIIPTETKSGLSDKDMYVYLGIDPF